MTMHASLTPYRHYRRDSYPHLATFSQLLHCHLPDRDWPDRPRGAPLEHDPSPATSLQAVDQCCLSDSRASGIMYASSMHTDLTGRGASPCR